MHAQGGVHPGLKQGVLFYFLLFFRGEGSA